MKEELVYARCRFMTSDSDAISLENATMIGNEKCIEVIMIGSNTSLSVIVLTILY